MASVAPFPKVKPRRISLDFKTKSIFPQKPSLVSQASQYSLNSPFLKLYFCTQLKEKVLIWVAFFCAVLSGALSPVFAILVSSVAVSFSETNISEGKTISLVLRNSLLFGLAGIVALITNTLSICLIKMISQSITSRLQKAYYTALMKQDLEWFDQQDSQELGRRGEMDCKIISDGTEDKLIQVIAGLASFIGGVIVALTRGWKLTLILLFIVPFQVGAALGYAHFIRKAVQNNLNAYAKAGTIANHAFHSLGTLVSLVAEEKECERYNQALYENKGKTMKYGLFQGLCIGLFNVSLYAFHILCFFVGFLFIEKEITGTDGRPYENIDVFSIFFAIFRGGFSLAIIGPGVKAIVEAKRAAARIFNIIEHQPKRVEHCSSPLILSNFQGKISFKNVFFTHSSDQQVSVLQGINLNIEPGQRIVLLGESGCGKSTLMRLIMRFYDVQDGVIEIDGVDIRKIDRQCLKKNFSFLTQECTLFTGTIKENLQLGKNEATEEEMIEVLKKAHAYDFVMKLNKGLDTRLGAQGISLSAGQKQRIALARTLLKNGKVILLDEPTASLDTNSEMELLKLFESLKNEGKTVVMTSHTLKTAKDADLVVVFEDGNIVEMGNHSALLELRGSYFDLWNAQIGFQSKIFETLESPQNGHLTKTFQLNTMAKIHSQLIEEEIIQKMRVNVQEEAAQTIVIEGEEKHKIVDSIVFKDSEVGPSTHELTLENGLISTKEKEGKNVDTDDNKSLRIQIEDEEFKEGDYSPRRKTMSTLPTIKTLMSTPQSKGLKRSVTGNERPLWSRTKSLRRSISITEVFRRDSRQWISPLLNLRSNRNSNSFGSYGGLAKLWNLKPTLKKLFYLNGLISLANGALAPIFGFIIGNIAHDLLDPDLLDDVDETDIILHEYGVFLFCIIFTTFLLFTFQFYSWTALSRNFNAALRAKLFNKMLRMQIAWHENIQHGPSTLNNVLSIETVNVSQLLNFAIGLLVQALSSVITASIIGFVYCWQITILSLVIGPIILVIVIIQSKVGAKMLLRTEEKRLAGQMLSEMVQHMTTVMTLDEKSLKKRYAKTFKKIQQRSMCILATQGFLSGLNQCIIMFYLAGVFYYGAYLSSNQIANIRHIFIVLFTMLFGVFNVLATLQLSPDIRNGFNSLGNLIYYLTMKSEIDIDDSHLTYSEPIKGDIEFRNVSFAYPGSRMNQSRLKNVSFKIQAGKKVALIGPNGSGKSTIFKLLLRYYDVAEGEILIDGINIKKFNLKHLRRGLRLVEEVPSLFYGTIEYNIKCGGDNATDEDVIEAARTANALDFITRSEFRNRRGSVERKNYGQSFQRMVGLEDLRLSKGQRQRISIARAVISKPKILLLDEATNALDTHSEVLIDESLNKLMENRTTFIITHRPATLKKVDQVLYFSEMGVISKESHDLD